MNRQQELEESIRQIQRAEEQVAEAARKRWNSIAKPLYSLGKLEEDLVRIAAMTGQVRVQLNPRALVVMCADNGVVEEGVTQTGQEVTAIVAENFLSCNTSAAIMCREAGIELFPYDIGMVTDTKVPSLPAKKLRYGTANMTKGPAMTREEAIQAILSGIEVVREKREMGFRLLCTGEMGIGNTTTSSAVAAVLLGQEPDIMTGRGAGLTDEGLAKKIRAIREAIRVNRPDAKDPIGVLSAVGGLDLAGLVGVFLGGAKERLPVLIDGFISAVAALTAVRICPAAADYMIVSHISKEPGMKHVMEGLGFTSGMELGMCLGEGSGAAAYVPLLDMACAVYEQMSTFSDNQITDYEDYERAGAGRCCI